MRKKRKENTEPQTEEPKTYEERMEEAIQKANEAWKKIAHTLEKLRFVEERVEKTLLDINKDIIRIQTVVYVPKWELRVGNAYVIWLRVILNIYFIYGTSGTMLRQIQSAFVHGNLASILIGGKLLVHFDGGTVF